MKYEINCSCSTNLRLEKCGTFCPRLIKCRHYRVWYKIQNRGLWYGYVRYVWLCLSVPACSLSIAGERRVIKITPPLKILSSTFCWFSFLFSICCTQAALPTSLCIYEFFCICQLCFCILTNSLRWGGVYFFCATF